MRALILLTGLTLVACGQSEVDAPIFDEDPLGGGSNGGNTNTNTNGNGNGNPCSADPVCADPDGDFDGDGLPNRWELDAGDVALLDPTRADTDGDGTEDGDEDFDLDGISTLGEFAFSRLPAATLGTLHPFRLDLVVELDAMSGRSLSDAEIQEAATAFAAAAIANIDGSSGIGLHVFRDQDNLAPQTFTADFGPRNAVLENNGPRYADAMSPAIPYAQMVHVVVALERTDIPGRGGEAVEGGNAAEAGLFVYYDALADAFPACGVVGTWPELSFSQALANTFAHELGHALQVGHDTDVGGGVNPFNVMALVTSCETAQERFNGLGNADATLGNTETEGAPRFSDAATRLMDFENRLSVDTGSIADEDM